MGWITASSLVTNGHMTSPENMLMQGYQYSNNITTNQNTTITDAMLNMKLVCFQTFKLIFYMVIYISNGLVNNLCDLRIPKYPIHASMGEPPFFCHFYERGQLL